MAPCDLRECLTIAMAFLNDLDLLIIRPMTTAGIRDLET